jgi:hypothetical protein
VRGGDSCLLLRRYLGLFESEIEAAMAYDSEAVRSRGLKAVTNFDMTQYLELLSPQDKETWLGLRQQVGAGWPQQRPPSCLHDVSGGHNAWRRCPAACSSSVQDLIR